LEEERKGKNGGRGEDGREEDRLGEKWKMGIELKIDQRRII
jgi:hypothetical protein